VDPIVVVESYRAPPKAHEFRMHQGVAALPAPPWALHFYEQIRARECA
jgi:hypothetical protein